MSKLKQKIIDIDAHAFFRMLERGIQFGLDHYETKERAFETVKNAQISTRKHRSNKNTTYYKYFNDNLSFYVVCKQKEFDEHILAVIKTVIIETGRE